MIEDVEAPPPPVIRGIVLGNDPSREEIEVLPRAFDMTSADPNKEAIEVEVLMMSTSGVSPPRMFDITIVLSSILYSLLIVILFTGTRIASNNSGNNTSGFDELLRGLTVIFVCGFGALIVAAVSLLLTRRRWEQLSTLSRVAGIFPTVCSIVLVFVIAVLVKLENDNHNNASSSSPVESP